MPANGDNLDFLRSLDMLVVAEKTSLVLKSLCGVKNLKIIHTRHGAGDRANGFDKASAGFDHMFCSGPNIRERLITEAGVPTEKISMVGYPKFDTVDPSVTIFPVRSRARVVLYNPPCSAHLSSWFRHGRQGRQVREGGTGDHWQVALWLDTQVRAWGATHLWTSLSRATILGLLVGQHLGLPVICWQHAAFLKPWNRRLMRLLQSRAQLWVGDSASVSALTWGKSRDRTNATPHAGRGAGRSPGSHHPGSAGRWSHAAWHNRSVPRRYADDPFPAMQRDRPGTRSAALPAATAPARATNPPARTSPTGSVSSPHRHMSLRLGMLPHPPVWRFMGGTPLRNALRGARSCRATGVRLAAP